MRKIERKRRARPVTKTADYLRGYASALAALATVFDQPRLAYEVAIADGLGIEDFEGLGLTEFDRDGIAAAFGASSP